MAEQLTDPPFVFLPSTRSTSSSHEKQTRRSSSYSISQTSSSRYKVRIVVGASTAAASLRSSPPLERCPLRMLLQKYRWDVCRRCTQLPPTAARLRAQREAFRRAAWWTRRLSQWSWCPWRRDIRHTHCWLLLLWLHLRQVHGRHRSAVHRHRAVRRWWCHAASGRAVGSASLVGRQHLLVHDLRWDATSGCTCRLTELLWL